MPLSTTTLSAGGGWILTRRETREKDDAFLLRVLETIRAGLNRNVPGNAADTLLRLLQGVQSQPAPVEEVSQEDQQEADDMALDFVDGF